MEAKPRKPLASDVAPYSVAELVRLSQGDIPLRKASAMRLLATARQFYKEREAARKALDAFKEIEQPPVQEQPSAYRLKDEDLDGELCGIPVRELIAKGGATEAFIAEQVGRLRLGGKWPPALKDNQGEASNGKA